jgi:hypothetical protein
VSTSAAIGFDEVQVELAVTFWVDPSVKTRVAVSCAVWPTCSAVRNGVTCSSLGIAWLQVRTVVSVRPM